jgi:uncharacterized protein DUF4440
LFPSRKLARIAPLAVLLSAALVSTSAFAASAADSSACTATPEDQAQIVETMRTMYAAATTDDLVKFHTVAAPDFYAFDGGKRYDGDALITMVKSFHDQGYSFQWTVADPHIEATCDLAWITYTNRGSIQDKSGTHPTTWLESAVLEKQAATWRIRFFHSTRVP